MTLAATPKRRFSGTLAGMTAVGVKDLRGRMRGKRAFIFLTFYLTVLTLFVWMIETIVARSAAFSSNMATASAEIGNGLFLALLFLQTLLVLFLGPAYTTGAISLERERQTLDLLSATPVSSLGIVLGKLLSALSFVFLIIVSSIPLTAIVFLFGGVAPEDVVRGYLVLIVTAFGLGSIGLFFSALLKRTQAATVLTYFTVLALGLGTIFLFIFFQAMGGFERLNRHRDNPIIAAASVGPEVMLWFNPFVSQVDVMCNAELGSNDWCQMIGSVTNRLDGFGQGGFPLRDDTGALIPAAENDPLTNVFWPRAALAWIVLSVVLILLSAQLLSPTRRWRFHRRRRPAEPDIVEIPT